MVVASCARRLGCLAAFLVATVKVALVSPGQHKSSGSEAFLSDCHLLSRPQNI